MEIVYTHCAGLDVHKKSVVACCIMTAPNRRKQVETRTFGTTTRQVLALLDWLLAMECTHVAMESTGDYWKPIYSLLEGHLELVLVNAAHIKHVPGRKTDVKDAEWIADLLRHGLLRGSFVPPEPQRDLRDLTRLRTTLLHDRARLVNRVQKVLETANIKLASVVSDIQGMSARAMLEALLTGDLTPPEMAALARGRLQQKLDQLEEALDGRVRDHHRFLLRHLLAQLDFLEQEVAAFDAEIVQRMADHEPPSTEEIPPSAPSPDTADAPPQTTPAPHTLGTAQAVDLLDTIPGISRRIAEIIIAEVGLDMTRFPSARHLAAWAGVAPGNNESAGKQRSGRPRRGNRALRVALAQAAHAAARTKGSYLRAQYHRLVGRRGVKRALGAVAHSIIVAVYHMLRRHEPYRDLGDTYFDTRRQEGTTNRLIHRLEQLGYQVELVPKAQVAAPAAS
jgi:transposase